MLCGSRKRHSLDVQDDLISEVSSQGQGQAGCINLGQGPFQGHLLENELGRLRVTSTPMAQNNKLRPLGEDKPCVGCMRVTARKVGLLKGRGKNNWLY